jgi:hypothetical protein
MGWMHVIFWAYQGTSSAGVRSVHVSIEWSCLVPAATFAAGCCSWRITFDIQSRWRDLGISFPSSRQTRKSGPNSVRCHGVALPHADTCKATKADSMYFSRQIVQVERRGSLEEPEYTKPFSWSVSCNTLSFATHEEGQSA